MKIYHVLGRRDGVEPSARTLSGAISSARSHLLEERASSMRNAQKLNQAKNAAILADAQAIIEAEGVLVETRLRRADLVETILAKGTGDLIVIGKRGEAADFAKLHLGSNLERIVRSSHKPVFVANREFKPVTNVLIAFDGGPSSLRAVDYLSPQQASGRPARHARLRRCRDGRHPQGAGAGQINTCRRRLRSRDNCRERQAGNDTLGGLVEDQEYDLVVMTPTGIQRIPQPDYRIQHNAEMVRLGNARAK
ncbi:MAG: universal stress protein [Tepidamorphaceae bacterium]